MSLLLASSSAPPAVALDDSGNASMLSSESTRPFTPAQWSTDELLIVVQEMDAWPAQPWPASTQAVQQWSTDDLVVAASPTIVDEDPGAIQLSQTPPSPPAVYMDDDGPAGSLYGVPHEDGWDVIARDVRANQATYIVQGEDWSQVAFDDTDVARQTWSTPPPIVQVQVDQDQCAPIVDDSDRASVIVHAMSAPAVMMVAVDTATPQGSIAAEDEWQILILGRDLAWSRVVWGEDETPTIVQAPGAIGDRGIVLRVLPDGSVLVLVARDAASTSSVPDTATISRIVDAASIVVSARDTSIVMVAHDAGAGSRVGDLATIAMIETDNATVAMVGDLAAVADTEDRATIVVVAGDAGSID